MSVTGNAPREWFDGYDELEAAFIRGYQRTMPDRATGADLDAIVRLTGMKSDRVVDDDPHRPETAEEIARLEVRAAVEDSRGSLAGTGDV